MMNKSDFEFSQDGSSIGYWPMADDQPMVVWFPLYSERGKELLEEYEAAA